MEILRYKSSVPLTGNVLGRWFDDDAIYYLSSAELCIKTHDNNENVGPTKERTSHERCSGSFREMLISLTIEVVKSSRIATDML